MPEIAEMPDLSSAMDLLNAAEAAEQPIPATELTQPDPNAEPQATPAATDGNQEAPNPSPTDTPTAADKPAEATDKKTVETPPKPGDPKPKSKFAEDAQRRDTSWKKLNEEKAAFKLEQDRITAERNAIAQERQKLQVEQAKARNRFTPEQYEQAATNKLASLDALELQAAGLEKRADQLEEQGEYAKAKDAKAQAQQLREQVTADKLTARQMKDMAAHLRANPDKTLEQHKQQLAGVKREALLQAAGKWPGVAQQGSVFQQEMSKVLQALKTSGLDAEEHPRLFYDVARLVAAETAAVRVPGLEKELGQLRAKVKELEALTAPGGGSGAVQKMPAPSAKNDADEEAELRQMAVGIS